MAAVQPLQITDATRITRIAERQVTDRRVLHQILDAGLVAHVGLVRDGTPIVLPVGYARDGDGVLVHGSSGGGLLRAAASGQVITVSVTLLDALVYARSLFDSSMNYRSAMITGIAQPVVGDAKLAALELLSEHLMPGRSAEVRATTKRDLAATVVLRLPLEQVSVKVRAQSATTAPDDGEDRAVWAGILPLHTAAGAPAPTDDTPRSTEVPASVRAAASSFDPGAEPTRRA